MSLLEFGNFGSTQLAGPISDIATTASLLSGAGALFPSPTLGQYFVLEFNDQATGLDHEVVHVTSRTGDTITIVRAQEGTVALNWSAGDLAYSGPTAGQLQVLAQVLVYAGDPNGHMAGTAPSGGLPPTFCWNTLTNILYACTTTGDAAGAVWSIVSSSTPLPQTELAWGQSYLTTPTNVTLLLAPTNGNNLIVGSAQYHLAAGGVTLTGNNSTATINGTLNQNIGASKTYLVAFNGTTMELYDTVGGYTHQPDTTMANIGVEVIWLSGTPLTGRSFLGWANTDGSSHFTVATSWFNQPSGRLLNVQFFHTAGTFTYLPTAGTNFVEVTVQGGHGAGGGATATGGGQVSLGSGGSSGGIAVSRLAVASVVGQTITVGAGGTGSSGANGGSGGSSSLGALLSGTGGGGGTFAAASAPPFCEGSFASGIGSGGNVYNAAGDAGGLGVASSTSSYASGQGASSLLGGGGFLRTPDAPGAGRAGDFGGGSGAAVAPSSSAQPGGNGGAGFCLIKEYY